MFITVTGVYRNGRVELLEVPAALAADENAERQVLVTFLSPPAIDLPARGITEAQAAELRTCLAPFAEDWNDTAMDLYDQYELNHAALARGRTG